MVGGQKVKAQGQGVAKHILGDRVARVSLHSIEWRNDAYAYVFAERHNG